MVEKKVYDYIIFWMVQFSINWSPLWFKTRKKEQLSKPRKITPRRKTRNPSDKRRRNCIKLICRSIVWVFCVFGYYYITSSRKRSRLAERAAAGCAHLPFVWTPITQVRRKKRNCGPKSRERRVKMACFHIYSNVPLLCIYPEVRCLADPRRCPWLQACGTSRAADPCGASATRQSQSAEKISHSRDAISRKVTGRLFCWFVYLGRHAMFVQIWIHQHKKWKLLTLVSLMYFEYEISRRGNFQELGMFIIL